MPRLAIAVLLLLLAGCAHPAPVLEAPAIAVAAPILYIRESLPRDAQICVVRNPWNDGTPICMTVGELRAILRSRLDVATHGVTR